MKTLGLLFSLFVCLLCNAQNEAYYLGRSGDLSRINLDSNEVIDYYMFLDSIVLKKTPETNLYLANENVLSPIGFSQNQTHSISKVIDSICVNNKWHRIEITQTDDNFVGGRQNWTTTNVFVNDIGHIYSSSNWLNIYTSIMICHLDSIKQKLLTSSFEHIDGKHPFVIEKSHLAKIISLTKEYNFSNLVSSLSKKWLAPRYDLKLLKTNSETINGQIQYSVTIKNISEKGYYFLWGSEFGPSLIEYQINDKRVIERIEGNYHGHYNFEKINESIYLNPGEEMSFSLKPNRRENCGGCDLNKFFGFQVYRYGVNFFNWIFTKEITHNDLNYRLYHLQEIK
jgi:hypothetical protein